MTSEWDILWRLGLALALSTAIGLERELRQKSAGLRTHTLVGLGSALFVMAGAYGFTDAVDPGHVVLDPSRVAAQVVSGIGFIGGGLIFVRRDAVRGLTTAAGVWLTAAVGMAAGAGLPVLAIAATGGYFLVVHAYPVLAQRLPNAGATGSSLRVTYVDGQGILREALARCTGAGFAVSDLSFDRARQSNGRPRAVVVRIELWGRGQLATLASELGDLDGVLAVSAHDPAEGD